MTAGLDKLGITTPIDTQLLAKGQPQAVLQLLQLLYAANPPESPAKKGLAPLDANSSGANGRGAKRRAPDTKKEAATTAEAEPSAEPLPQPAEPLPSAIETALRTQLEDTRAQLILSRTKAQHLIEERDFYVQVRVSRHCPCQPPQSHPTHALRWLDDQKVVCLSPHAHRPCTSQKLELIEDACQQDDASEDLSARILRLLRADENEVAGAALGE